ncbi:MAG: RecQ family ATP-dependent DNA helicase, partial [Saccharofermentanales bacterium]
MNQPNKKEPSPFVVLAAANKKEPSLFVLKTYFGHAEFRDGQEPIINCILSGRDVLGVMPTGAGKSICYQLPALMMDGVTLVISPLISLMKDQVNALTQSGVHAAFLNRSLTAAQYDKAIRQAGEGRYKIIYVAPERLMMADFLQMCSRIDISLVAVDESHCVSQWGQDFRPSYLKIVTFVEQLRVRPVIAAFTATATREVKADISTILRLRDPYVITTGFDRPNLNFSVKKPEKKPKELLKMISRFQGKNGIVYCATRKVVEEVCDLLCEAGFLATRYHAGL